MGEQNSDIPQNLIKLLEENNARLIERERDLADKTEELLSQKEELTAAIEELMNKNQSLSVTLNQLRERNFELDQILYRTSHDLRAPLSSIKGIINLIKSDQPQAIGAEYRIHIEDKVNQMDCLLTSLSSLSKTLLEEPDLSTVYIDKLVAKILEDLDFPTRSNQINLSLNILQSSVKSDSFLITTILNSLISNALTFRDLNQKGMLSVTSSEENSWLVIDVIDDGEGIPPEVLPHIFNMFYRGSERSKGSGLGLYVAKKAAERLNGTIEVISKKGSTCFRVKLPFLN